MIETEQQNQQTLKNEAATLTTVDFHGDPILATYRGGKIWLPLRHLCDVLGLNYSAQYRRLTSKKRSPWATVVIMATVAEDQKQREVVAIDLRTMTMWLANATTGKVRPEVRDKVVQYQNEAADVLLAHFFPASPPAPPAPAEDDVDELCRSSQLYQAIQRTLDLCRSQLRMERDLAVVRESATRAEAKAEAAGHLAAAAVAIHTSNHGYYTVLGYARLLGREMPKEEAQRHGKELSAICRGEGHAIHRQRDGRYGEVNSYPESVLRRYFDSLTGGGPLFPGT